MFDDAIPITIGAETSGAAGCALMAGMEPPLSRSGAAAGLELLLAEAVAAFFVGATASSLESLLSAVSVAAGCDAAAEGAGAAAVGACEGVVCAGVEAVVVCPVVAGVVVAGAGAAVVATGCVLGFTAAGTAAVVGAGWLECPWNWVQPK